MGSIRQAMLGALWPLLLAAAACLRRALQMVRMFLRHRRLAARIPGPWPWPLVGNVFQLGFDHRYIMNNIAKECTKAYPVVRIWMGPLLGVIVQDPKDIEVVLSKYELKAKPFLYNALRPWVGDGLLTSEVSVWRERRRKLQTAFRPPAVAPFVPVFRRQAHILLARLAEHAAGPAFDIMPLLEHLTLDAVSESAMGVHMNTQFHGGCEYLAAYKKAKVLGVRHILSPWLYPEWMYRLSPLSKRIARYAGIGHGIRDKVVKVRKLLLQLQAQSSAHADNSARQRCRPPPTLHSEPGEGHVFLDHLLSAVQRGAPLSDQDIADEVDTFMAGGHDKLAVTLAVVLYLLATHPVAQQRVLEEVEHCLGSGWPPEPTTDDLGGLQYLGRVIQEALRLYPVVMIYLRHVDRDVRLATSDLLLPKGCMVALSPYVTHRARQLWADPDTFDPDRWLPERAARRHRFSYFPFGAGPRDCIGRSYADMTLRTVVAQVLWRYRLLPVPGFELQHVWTITSSLETGCWIKVEARRRSGATPPASPASPSSPPLSPLASPVTVTPPGTAKEDIRNGRGAVETVAP